MRGPVGALLGSLTVRGRCLVAAGGTLLLVGVVLGERSLVQVAVFVLALPLVAAAMVARERFRLSSRRTVTPARLPRGEDAEVLLELTNTDRRTGGSWLLTEGLAPELGEPPRFVVERLAGSATAELRYRVHGGRRGRHALGPLQLRVVDPFGLVLRSTSGADTVPLVVVPRVRPLDSGGPSAGHGGTGEGARRSIAVHGEDDVSTREYRHGDDLRKVHWKATARTGELMVRLEERPWRAQATLLLDARARAHLLAPRLATLSAPPVTGPDPDPPPDTLEWVVEAAASIGTWLARRGAMVRVVTDTGDLLPADGHGNRSGGLHGGIAPEQLLDQLAGVTASRAAHLGPAVDRAARAAGDGPLICLLGAVGADDVVDLIRARSGPTTDLAVLVDLAGWAGEVPARRRSATASRAELTRQRDEAADLLRAAGWQVAVAGAGQSVPEVWAALTRPGSAPWQPPAGALEVPA